MMFPIIRVKDKCGDIIHIVGTDSHDQLYIDDNGQIHYYNLQNGEGTNGDYSFVGVESEWCGRPEIEFVDIDELLTIFMEQTDIDAKKEAAIRNLAHKHREKLDREKQFSADDGIINS